MCNKAQTEWIVKETAVPSEFFWFHWNETTDTFFFLILIKKVNSKQLPQLALSAILYSC